MNGQSRNQELQRQEHDLESKINLYRRVGWGFVAFGFLALIGGVLAALPLQHPFALEHLASLGSFYQGTVASFWSLAALFFIYVAFLGQKQQFLIQKEQLLNQQEQLDRQDTQLEAQNQTAIRQNFENTFFQLLGLHNKITSQMQHNSRPSGTKGYNLVQEAKGHDCFSQLFDSLYRIHDDVRNNKAARSDPRASASLAYEHLYASCQDELGHYFRNLYHLFKFVKESGIQDKRRYTSLARAQLSAYELLLLFYNGISATGVKFKPLIEEFGLLENMDKKLLLDESHEGLYSASAFQ